MSIEDLVEILKLLPRPLNYTGDGEVKGGMRLFLIHWIEECIEKVAPEIVLREMMRNDELIDYLDDPDVLFQFFVPRQMTGEECFAVYWEFEQIQKAGLKISYNVTKAMQAYDAVRART